MITQETLEHFQAATANGGWKEDTLDDIADVYETTGGDVLGTIEKISSLLSIEAWQGCFFEDYHDWDDLATLLVVYWLGRRDVIQDRDPAKD